MIISLASPRDRPDPLELGEAALQNEIAFEVPSKTDLLVEVADILLSLFEQTPLTPRDVKDLKQAVLEMGFNAIEWDHGNNPKLCFHITYRVRPDAVVLTVRDQGPGFDHGVTNRLALVANDPEAYRKLHEAREASAVRYGFGVDLSMALVDEFFYNGPGNQVTLIKRFSGLSHEPMTEPSQKS